MVVGFLLVSISAQMMPKSSSMTLPALWNRMDAAYAAVNSFAGIFSVRYGGDQPSLANLILVDNVVVFDAKTEIGDRIVSTTDKNLRWLDSAQQTNSVERKAGRELFLQLLEIGQFPATLVVPPFSVGTSYLRKMIKSPSVSQSIAGLVIRGKTAIGEIALTVSDKTFLVISATHTVGGISVTEELLGGYAVNNRVKILDLLKNGRGER